MFKQKTGVLVAQMASVQNKSKGEITSQYAEELALTSSCVLDLTADIIIS
jgi:hypothetical protein